MERSKLSTMRVVLLLALMVALLLHAMFQAELRVAASPVGLTFHSGFETGDFAEWNSALGSVSVQNNPKMSGDYAMRCNPSSFFGFTFKSGSAYRLTVHLYTVSSPSNDCSILGAWGSVYVGLSNNRYLKLYGSSLKDTGTTQLNIATWYRISLCLDPAYDSAKVYLDGVEECSSTSISSNYLENWLGPQDTVTADFYFDNYASDDIASTSDIGDIRVVRASPNAAGTYTQFDTVVGGAVHYQQVDEYPASDGDYVQHSASTAAIDSYGLQDCSTIGIGAKDTIKAVAIWVRAKRSGGGETDHQILVGDGGSDLETLFEPSTSFAWYGRYDDDLPNGGGAWTQVRFNSLEVGGSNSNGGGQDYYLSCVMVMVAYLRTTWDSYMELGHATLWGTEANPYDSNTQTVYMYGEGFAPSYQYRVAYYDAPGAKTANAQNMQLQ